MVFNAFTVYWTALNGVFPVEGGFCWDNFCTIAQKM